MDTYFFGERKKNKFSTRYINIMFMSIKLEINFNFNNIFYSFILDTQHNKFRFDIN